MATRATARAALAGLITSAGGFTTVNAFLPLTLGGTTKVCNVYARASDLEVRSAHLKKDFHIFYIDTLVRRRGTIADADDQDALHEIIATVCKNNPTNANWEHLEMDGETDARIVKDESIQYLLEQHRVKVKLSG